MRNKLLLSLIALVVIGAIAFYVMHREVPTDTRFSGAYTLEDGTLVLVTPREGKELRYKLLNGESGALWPTGDDAFEGGPGWGEKAPVVNRIQFQRNEQGIQGFIWQRAASSHRATKLHLREEFVTFRSGDLTLRAKLVLPDGEGPFPVVVPVHGSEDYSAVDHYSDPYMHAANGIACLVYDKRGTGGSEGEYTANFDVLSNDAIAAVNYLRTRQEIDTSSIHLAGYSQGGWIAPLAALKDGHIRSVLVGFGVAVPVTGEDRWGYVYALERAGFGEQEIAEVDRVNAIIEDIFDRGQDRWDEFERAHDEARTKPWYDAVKKSDSAFGMIASAEKPLWMTRLFLWWEYGRFQDPPFIDRTYDPAVTLAKLETPTYWIFGGKDSSAPTPWSVAVLERLKAQGKPIDYFIYPDAEHGIRRFEELPDGERRTLGFEADYFPRQLQWFKTHSGRL